LARFLLFVALGVRLISDGNTCIANLSNNTEYQVVQINKDPTPKITSTGNPGWEYPIEGKIYSPVIFDINNDGYEEVFCLSIGNSDVYNLYCLNYSDGSLRWLIEDFTEGEYIFYPDILTGNFNGEFNSIIIFDKYGNTFNVYESPVGVPQVVNYQVLTDCIEIVTSPVASDINKDGIAEVILVYRGLDHSGEEVLKLVNINANEFIINTILILDYEGNIIHPVISDLNNDGQSEIILGVVKNGIYIYNMELILQNYIPDNKLLDSEFVIGDIYNDGDLDILCLVGIDNFTGIRGYNINGTQTSYTSVLGKNMDCWIEDIDNNSTFDLVYSVKDELFVTNITNAGKDIGWPGQSANIRNTGVYEQPAYFGESGETVYWANTIILSPDVDNIIPGGSTVIIKPGTKIKAHANSSLIIQGTLIAEGTEKFPVVFSADITGAEKGYWQGIAVSNHSILSLKYCEIKDAEIGVLFEYNNDEAFTQCLLENNIVGIGAFHSSPIIKENIVTENTTGISCYNSASPILADPYFETPYKNGIVNNMTGIKLNKSMVYLNHGYNDIYNLFSGGYYINNVSDPPSNTKAKHNYWGTTDLVQIYANLNPPEYFTIVPVLSSPQSSYVYEGDEESDMLQSASFSMEAGDYATAEDTYKTIIQQYPESSEAYVSISGLYDCTQVANWNWSNLEDYYNGLYSDSTHSQVFKNMVFGYINLCKRKQGNYEEAISNYEAIVQNNPTYIDSVFAVIDIGNTYEEAGNYKSTLGQLSELIPVNRAKHVEKTVDLLLSLKNSEILQRPKSQNIQIVELFPNPVKEIVTLQLKNTVTNSISIEFFDITGRSIQRKELGVLGAGDHEIEVNISRLNPGIYHIAVFVNNSVIDSKKLVVK